MKRIAKTFLATLGLTAGMIVGSAVESEAALIAWICETPTCIGANDLQIVDGGAGDTSPIAGSIVAVGVNIGGFIVTVNNSTSKPLLPQPSMDLNFSATTTNPTGGHIWLYTSDTNFTTGGSLFGTLDGNSSSSGTIQACIYGGTNNASGTIANQVCGASAPLPGVFSEQLTHPGGIVNPYALTIGVEIIATSAGITTGDFLVTPEPATMGLFALALFGLGGAVRRRFSN